ncbi:MAG: dihydroneopterin aldolase [Actinomycetota bacterium]
MTSDVLFVRGLRVSCRIGVPDEERARPQVVVIDVEAETDLASASLSDDLTDTLDYGTLTGEIARVATATDARLLEHLAGVIADRVLGFEGIERVTVAVAKERAPIPEEVEAVGVRIVRSAR